MLTRFAIRFVCLVCGAVGVPSPAISGSDFQPQGIDGGIGDEMVLDGGNLRAGTDKSPTPSMADANEESGISVLAASSDIGDVRNLVAAVRDDVLVVKYDAAETSLQDLAAMIDAVLDGRKADSIGFAAHSGGQPGQLHLNRFETTDQFTLVRDEEQQAFWRSLGELLSDEGRIDILACNAAGTDAGERLVQKLEALSGVQVFASVDATGNSSFGGNWLLERGGIDARAVYFDAVRLARFEGVLAYPIVDQGVAPPNQEIQIDPNHASTVVIPVPANAFFDADGDTYANGRLHYGAAYDQNEMTFFQDTFYVFGLDAADHDAVNAETVYLRAWDDGGSITTNYAVTQFTIYPDRFPTVGAGIADFTVNEVESGSTSWSIPANAFSDLDGDTLSYYAEYDTTWVSFSGDTFEFFPDDNTIPTANTNIVVRAYDAFGSEATHYAEISFHVTPVNLNDAPVLNAANDSSLPSISQDILPAANVGATIGNILIDGSITDEDVAPPATPPEAIAITGVDNSNGSWEHWYANAFWRAIDDGSLSDDHALLLDANDKIRFQPHAGFAGDSTVTFRAWDQTSGTAENYADANPNGGRTAFSNETDTLSIRVSPSNPPVTIYAGPSATGSGNITASFTGGGATCTFVNPQFIDVGAVGASPPSPPGVVFPHGLFDFTATGCTPGSTIQVTVTYPANLPPGAQNWKYGPTPDNATPHWYILPATISGNQVVFSITDGGLGDDDLDENGTFVEPGGAGAWAVGGPSARGVPLLTAPGLILLSGLLALVGLRRRPG